MQVRSLNCPECGGPIKVPDDVEHLNCAYCGSTLALQKGEGYYALKTIGEIRRVENAVATGTERTVEELKQIQRRQDLQLAYEKLDRVRLQIREVSASKKSRKRRKQLEELGKAELAWLQHIAKLKQQINPQTQMQAQAPAKRKTKDSRSWLIPGLATIFLYFLLVELFGSNGAATIVTLFLMAGIILLYLKRDKVSGIFQQLFSGRSSDAEADIDITQTDAPQSNPSLHEEANVAKVDKQS